VLVPKRRQKPLGAFQMELPPFAGTIEKLRHAQQKTADESNICTRPVNMWQQASQSMGSLALMYQAAIAHVRLHFAPVIPGQGQDTVQHRLVLMRHGQKITNVGIR
jgi:hypothetical protein